MFQNLILKQSFTRNRIFIGGNWKSNNSIQDSVAFVNNIINGLNFSPQKLDVVITPTNIHIPHVQQTLKHPNVKIAAQNSSNFQFGAYTGEISPKHLKDLGLEWVLLGHVERRTLNEEDNQLVVSKTMKALENNMKVIFCFGETLEDKEQGRTFEALEKQILPLIESLPSNSDAWSQSLVLAYQPAWAIGTGKSSSTEETRQVFNWIRNRLSENIENADKVRIIYGGSANSKNAKQYLDISSVDGLLLGGASLKPEFAKIVNICERV